jgi:hypothetical protein
VPELNEILAQTVFSDGSNVAFGELSGAAVRARADELQAAVGWGPTARVAGVARAWRELALNMDRAGVTRVADLDPETVVRLAPALWVIAPGGSLLG